MNKYSIKFEFLCKNQPSKTKGLKYLFQKKKKLDSLHSNIFSETKHCLHHEKR